MFKKFNLTGKVALVTGCNRGIGKAITLGLAEAGADIIGVSKNLKLDDSEIEHEVVQLGQNFTAYQCDFSDRHCLYQFIERVKSDFPKIDILVNNAGTIERAPAAEHPDELWDNVIEVNLNSQFILARELAQSMLINQSGKIIFIASLLSFQGGINVPGYAASKGAIAQLVKALANEWAGKGVNVNAIAPGYIDTDNTKDLKTDPIRSKAILDRIPQDRWGNPDDLKGPTVFLASDASNYINGTVLLVDGGWMGR